MEPAGSIHVAGRGVETRSNRAKRECVILSWQVWVLVLFVELSNSLISGQCLYASDQEGKTASSGTSLALNCHNSQDLSTHYVTVSVTRFHDLLVHLLLLK